MPVDAAQPLIGIEGAGPARKGMMVKYFLIQGKKLLPVSSSHSRLSLQPAGELFLILAAGIEMIEAIQILLKISFQPLCPVR